MNQQMMADLLRQKAQLNQQAGQATDQAQIIGSQFQNPQFQIDTPGYSTNINGRQAVMPGQTQVNYGDIIGKGIANYAQAKGMKTARELQAKSKEIENAFMQDSIGNDEQAQKLYGAAQAGVKGAQEALVQHLNPKKEAMAGLIQGVTSGNMDANMARQLAPKYGIDPEVAAAAADHAGELVKAKQQGVFDNKTSLQSAKDAAAQQRLSQQLSSKEQIANQAALAKPPRETMAEKLAAKRADGDIDTLDHIDNSISRVKDIVRMANEAKYLPLNMGLAPDAVNPKGVMLKQAMAGIVLDALGGKLGAGISNADVSFVKEAQANLERGNRETAMAQFKEGMEKLQQKRDAVLKRQGKSTVVNDGTAELPKSQYDSTAVKRRASSGAPVPSFEDIMKDFE